MEYRFGDFIFDTRSGSIIGPTGPIVLRRQTVRLLEVLLSHAPELLDRNTLLDQAWGRTALSANVLPQAISELRHALGDSAQSPRYIETLHRRGYRIVRPVEIIDESVPASVTGTVEKSSGTRSPALWLGLAASVVILPTMSLLWWKEAADRSWLHGEAVPEIRELMRTDLTTAWRRAREIRDTVRRDPILEQLWLDLTLPLDLTSDPDGALIEVRGYRELDRDWITLGHTPIAEARLPIAMLRFRVSLDGDRTLESAPGVLPAAEPFILHPNARHPGRQKASPGPRLGPHPTAFPRSDPRLPGMGRSLARTGRQPLSTSDLRGARTPACVRMWGCSNRLEFTRSPP